MINSIWFEFWKCINVVLKWIKNIKFILWGYFKFSANWRCFPTYILSISQILSLKDLNFSSTWRQLCDTLLRHASMFISLLQQFSKLLPCIQICENWKKFVVLQRFYTCLHNTIIKYLKNDMVKIILKFLLRIVSSLLHLLIDLLYIWSNARTSLKGCQGVLRAPKMLMT